MATLDSLKSALRQQAPTASSPKQLLSDTQYSAGCDIFVQGSGRKTYQDFIIPQLTQLLGTLFNSRAHVSVLEIGPGPKSILGYLPDSLRPKIKRYAAFEPNGLFASRLEKSLCDISETECPLPCLERPPDIYQIPFDLNSNGASKATTDTSDSDEKFDVILFCHSMYGMNPKTRFIERALEMLVDRPEGGGMVVVFHRDGSLYIDRLMCNRTALFPTGLVSVEDDDEILDLFAAFVAGFTMQDEEANKAIRVEWRKACRALSRREEAHPDRLLFSAPDVMAAFTQHATKLPELTAQVPLEEGGKIVKNGEARLHNPAAIVRPTEVRHIQRCVQWALKHGVGLTVVGGGHSGHCIWPGVVAVDMDAFDKVHIVPAAGDNSDDGRESGLGSGCLIVAEAGCKTGDIVRKAMESGLTVPLGARPSVGAGLWLQGGIGHLSRQYGLACDAIIGAMIVGVDSGQILCIGRVPNQHRPSGAERPENEADLLWAIKGAGTNVGIVVSVVFKAFAAPSFSTRNWVVPLRHNLEARRKLRELDEFIARKLPRNCSADAYLYWDTGQLHLGVTMFETEFSSSETPIPTLISTVLGPEKHFKKGVDGVGLFEAEMYMSGMHGGHGGGRTSSFKRCVFLKGIGTLNIADKLVAAVETRPLPLCYLHLLQGGGAIRDVAADATAFGCRDWDFACVITGVWPRDQDGTKEARAAVHWVYQVARDLLPLSSGVYGADLGPDPRDVALAARAFGANQPRLARLKHISDPRNVLAYTSPLGNSKAAPKLIVLVSGESCAGKDYCAAIWVSLLRRECSTHNKSFTACAASISDATKREYAAATGSDLNRLLRDRAYKEEHRPALTAFFQDQVRLRPRLPEEHFLNVVYGAGDMDVLVITGMRDEAPVTAFSHLVPESRVLDVRVKAKEATRRARGGHNNNNSSGDNSNNDGDNYCPSLIFNNDATGNGAAESFVKRRLLPFLHDDLQRLNDMVRLVPDFPRAGIEFRHVLNITQKPGGLALCTGLLQSHFTGDWASVDAVACCEAGGFVFASALASRVDVPLALVRKTGKLPPPTVSVLKPTSHISASSSSAANNDATEDRIEMDRDLVHRGASVVVVDDVLATGKTLCAVLQLLLGEVGISPENVSIMVVAEFPLHRGRELLRQRGFGRVSIQSLLIFDGV